MRVLRVLCFVYVCACSGRAGGREGSGVYVYVVRHLLRARTSTSCAQLEAPRRGAPRDAHDNVRRRCVEVSISRTFDDNNRLSGEGGLIFRGVVSCPRKMERRAGIPKSRVSGGCWVGSGKWISRW